MISIDAADLGDGRGPCRCGSVTCPQCHLEAVERARQKQRRYVRDGAEHTLAEWAAIAGVNYHVLRARIHKFGWSLEDAMDRPVQKKTVPAGLHWGKANTKLEKLSTLSFGIPAGVARDGFNTCPSKGACAGICYAREGHYTFPWVAARQEQNLAIVRASLDRFVESAIDDLTRLAPETPGEKQIVRVHDSGDFFSRDYMFAWFEVASALRATFFYAYTKQFHALSPWVWAFKPENFQVVQSAGGLHDDKIDFARPHAVIFGSREELDAAGYVYGGDTDAAAIEGEAKIGLVYHTSKHRSLTAPQARALRVLPSEAAL